MRAGLMARISELPNLTHLTGVRCAHITSRTGAVHIRLSDGQQITAKLLIGADGRGSLVRQHFGIGLTQRDFRQQALTFAVGHPVPHQNISTEVHDTGGPFTLVPLPDVDGKPASAVVWMDDSAKAGARLRLTPEAFAAEATARCDHALGPLKLISPRTAWPIVSQLAHRFYAERTALIAEAAHVMPPVGAQGLNTSIKDISTLRDTLAGAVDIGDEGLLRTYHRARHGDVKLRMAGVDFLNRTSIARNPLLKAARPWGLEAIHTLPPIRKALMRMGVGMGMGGKQC